MFITWNKSLSNFFLQFFSWLLIDRTEANCSPASFPSPSRSLHFSGAVQCQTVTEGFDRKLQNFVSLFWKSGGSRPWQIHVITLRNPCTTTSTNPCNKIWPKVAELGLLVVKSERESTGACGARARLGLLVARRAPRAWALGWEGGGPWVPQTQNVPSSSQALLWNCTAPIFCVLVRGENISRGRCREWFQRCMFV